MEDVKAAVALAAEGERLGMWSGPAPLAVCGGGHSEHCLVDGGVVLLMHRMAPVHVDAVAKQRPHRLGVAVPRDNCWSGREAIIRGNH